MTREEAKRFLVEHCNPRYPDSDKSQWDEAINLAISALGECKSVIESLPSAQQDSKELSLTQNALDTISRKAAIDEIRKCRFVVDAIEKIRALPSAQRKGRWVAERYMDETDSCSIQGTNAQNAEG